MEKNKQMTTVLLKYDIIGKECPNGMTRENCPLRKELCNWRKKFAENPLTGNFGYSVLENGNLLVPQFDFISENSCENFNLNKAIKDTCDGTCFCENRKKEKDNPNEFRKQPQIQTVVFAYTICGINCSVGMSHDNCPLRRELAETEEKYHIGYSKLSERLLLVPNRHYDSATNVYRDISQRCIKICDKCFEQSHQR